MDWLYVNIARRDARMADLEEMTPEQRARWLAEEQAQSDAKRLAEVEQATASERADSTPEQKRRDLWAL